MKKILSFLFVLIILTVTMPCANAENIIKSYQGYTILNKKLSEILPLINTAVEEEKDIIKLKGTNTYYWTYKDEHVYLRVYAANNNTDLYIVSDTDYDKNNNSITDLLKSKGYAYEFIKDREALKEYKFDFVDCARSGALDGLFILPDYVKPLKTGVGKVNEKISSFSKKNSAIPYTEDKDPIDLTCVDTKTYSNAEAQISIVQKEYRLKNKENKYVHAFEYVLHNNANSPITIDKVTSERLASLKDVEADAFVDIDRLNVLDFFGSFAPVVICTCGLSLIASVPNWVRTVNLTKESMRYTQLLPENYNLPANQKMRILVLKYKKSLFRY